MVKMQTGVEGAIASPINSPLCQNFSLKSKNNHKNSKKAFSVAEATIALLIGSVALGMAAPMITKQIKTQNMADIESRVVNQKIRNLTNDNEEFKTEMEDLIAELREELLDEIKNAAAFPSGSLLLTTDSCPTAGWSDVTNSYNGAFFKAGSSGIGSVANPSGNLPEHYHFIGIFTQQYNNDANVIQRTFKTKYNYTLRDLDGDNSGHYTVSSAAGNKIYAITTGQELVYPSNAVKNSTYQPKNVTVRVCKKN